MRCQGWIGTRCAGIDDGYMGEVRRGFRSARKRVVGGEGESRVSSFSTSRVDLVVRTVVLEVRCLEHLDTSNI